MRMILINGLPEEFNSGYDMLFPGGDHYSSRNDKLVDFIVDDIPVVYAYGDRFCDAVTSFQQANGYLRAWLTY